MLFHHLKQDKEGSDMKIKNNESNLQVTEKNPLILTPAPTDFFDNSALINVTNCVTLLNISSASSTNKQMNLTESSEFNFDGISHISSLGEKNLPDFFRDKLAEKSSTIANSKTSLPSSNITKVDNTNYRTLQKQKMNKKMSINLPPIKVKKHAEDLNKTQIKDTKLTIRNNMTGKFNNDIVYILYLKE